MHTRDGSNSKGLLSSSTPSLATGALIVMLRASRRGTIRGSVEVRLRKGVDASSHRRRSEAHGEGCRGLITATPLRGYKLRLKPAGEAGRQGRRRRKTQNGLSLKVANERRVQCSIRA